MLSRALIFRIYLGNKTVYCCSKELVRKRSHDSFIIPN